MAGIDAPDIAALGQEFVIRLTGIDDPTGVQCRIVAETGRSVMMPALRMHEAALIANITLGEPGLYRIQVTVGGHSAIEQLVMIAPI